MIRHWLASAGSLLVEGPLLALLGGLVLCAFGVLCHARGRASALREIDERRGVVLAAMEAAARPEVGRRLPGQRGGGS